MVKVNQSIVADILNYLNYNSKDKIILTNEEFYKLISAIIKLYRKKPQIIHSTITKSPVTTSPVNNIEKTFYFGFGARAGLVKVHKNRLIMALENLGWQELTIDQALEKNRKKIGLVYVFPFTDEFKEINLKSQYRYRITAQTFRFFSDKNTFFENIDQKYIPYNKKVNKNNLDKEIANLPGDKNKYLIKDPLGSLGKGILSVGEYLSKTTDERSQILDQFYAKDGSVQLTELIETFTMEKDDVIYNYTKYNNLGGIKDRRKVGIRFNCTFYIERDKIIVYRNKYLNFKLAPIAVSDDPIKDRMNKGTYIPNVTDFSVTKLNNDGIPIPPLFDNIKKAKGANIETFHQLVFASEKEIIKYKGQEFLNKLKEKVDEFIRHYFEENKYEFGCHNDYLMNPNFVGCFNHVGFDSIYTEEGDFKVLEINSNPQGSEISNMELKLSLTWIDSIRIIENKMDCLMQLIKVIEIDRPEFDKLSYVSNIKAKHHPTVVNLLKKNNYLRLPRNLFPPFPTGKYIDYQFKGPGKKQSNENLDEIGLSDEIGVSDENISEAMDENEGFISKKKYGYLIDRYLKIQNYIYSSHGSEDDDAYFKTLYEQYELDPEIMKKIINLYLEFENIYYSDKGSEIFNIKINITPDHKKFIKLFDYLYYYTFESTFDLDDEEQRPKDVPTLLGGGNDYDKFVKVTYIINNIYEKLGNKKNLYNSLEGSDYAIDFIKFDKNDININKIKNFMSISRSKDIQKCKSFILKPDLGAQGRGISIIETFSDFEKWKNSPSMFTKWTLNVFYDSHTLIPKNANYEPDEFRKYHVRVYYLIILDKDNKWELWKLNIPLIYFAVEPYPKDCENLGAKKDALITNLARSKEIIKRLNVDENLKNYTNKFSDYKDRLIIGEDDKYNKILNNMDEIMMHCFDNIITKDKSIECKNKLNNKQYYGCHHIIANDYQILPDYSVKLLELNGGPGFINLKNQTGNDYTQIWEEYLKIAVYKTYLNEIGSITYWENLRKNV